MIDRIDPVRAAELYRGGRDQAAIAAELGCSQPTVSRALARVGATRDTDARRVAIASDLVRAREEIAERHGVTFATVKSIERAIVGRPRRAGKDGRRG